jgi:hypothetical protein
MFSHNLKDNDPAKKREIEGVGGEGDIECISALALLLGDKGYRLR